MSEREIAAALRIHRRSDAEDAAGAAAELVVAAARRAVEARGSFRLALSGGGTPERLHARLAATPTRDLVPWPSVEIFWGDERCVPADDPASNQAMARRTLLDHVPVAPHRVHPIDGTASPERAADDYARVLGPEPLDLVLLGLGTDGHVASLFPGGPELDDPRRVVATASPAPPRDRVSIGLSTLNAAREVAVLVTGERKAAVLRRILAGASSSPVVGENARLPAALLRPSGPLHWVLDAAAASLLDRDAQPSRDTDGARP